MSIAFITFAALAAAAAVSDIRRRKVSNRLNLAILFLGLGWRATTLGGTELLLGLAGVGVGLAVLFAPFAARWVGAGDVKFLAAAGAWLAPHDVALAGIVGCVGGGVLAVAITAFAGTDMRRAVVRNVAASIATMSAPVAPRRPHALTVPLAVPLAAASIAIFLARATGV